MNVVKRAEKRRKLNLDEILSGEDDEENVGPLPLFRMHETNKGLKRFLDGNRVKEVTMGMGRVKRRMMITMRMRGMTIVRFLFTWFPRSGLTLFFLRVLQMEITTLITARTKTEGGMMEEAEKVSRNPVSPFFNPLTIRCFDLFRRRDLRLSES